MRILRKLSLALIVAAYAAAMPGHAQAAPPAGCLLVNEVYANGGETGAHYDRDFVELFNRCNDAVALTGLYLTHASSDGLSSTSAPLSGSMAARSYYLIAGGSPGSAGSPLPSPDALFIGLDNPGKVFLTDGSPGSNTCPTGAIDRVGYGTSSFPCHEGANPTLTPAPYWSVQRLECPQDTNDNYVDFSRRAPSPQSSSAPALGPCAPPTGCLLVNEVYANGGETGAHYNQDFVELFNRCNEPVLLGGLYLWHTRTDGSATGALLSGSVAARRYYLVAAGSAGGVGTPLPSPNGGLATNLDNVGTVFLGVEVTTCPSGPAFVDRVGYGTSSFCYEGPNPTPQPTATQSVARSVSCNDTNNNAADFTLQSPTPQNSSSPQAGCTATSVKLRSISATRSKSGVVIRWQMAAETSLLGFNVYRQIGAKRFLVNRTPIAVTGRRSYSFLDRRAPASGKIRYRLEGVSASGKRTWLGQVQAP